MLSYQATPVADSRQYHSALDLLPAAELQKYDQLVKMPDQHVVDFIRYVGSVWLLACLSSTGRSGFCHFMLSHASCFTNERSRRYLMEQCGVRQSDIADVIGVTQGRVSQVLTGKSQLSTRTKRDLVRALALVHVALMSFSLRCSSGQLPQNPAH